MNFMQLIKNLSDRILFAVGLILFMQVPQFVNQYTQRLGGYLQGQQEQLTRYQQIADEHFSGELSSMVAEFRESSKGSVRNVGDNLQLLIQKVNETKADLQFLEEGALLSNLSHLSYNLNTKVATETLRTFVPGVPITLEALACGLSGGILLSALLHLLLKLPFTRMKFSPRGTSSIARRVEPKV